MLYPEAEIIQNAGFEILDEFECKIEFEDSGGYAYLIDIDQVSDSDTKEDIINNSELYCPYGCGGMIDNDSMFCWSCKEHA